MMAVIFRRGTIEDSMAVYQVLRASVKDLSERQGLEPPADVSDVNSVTGMWQVRQPFFEHLARTAYEFWVAEDEGCAIGYARSILREGVSYVCEIVE